MTMIHPTAIRNEIVDLVVDKIDIGSGANGTLELQTSLSVVLAIHDFSVPAFGVSASGSATANAISSTTAIATGSATKFVCKDKDGTLVCTGAITAVGGGGDIEASGVSISITSGDTINITSLTYNGNT